MSAWWWHSWVKWFCLTVAAFLIYAQLTEATNQCHSVASVTLSACCLNISALALCHRRLRCPNIHSFSKRRLLQQAAHLHAPADRCARLHTTRRIERLNGKFHTRATESTHGFALFHQGSRSFNWLPMHGFASPEEINQCRELIRKNSQKFEAARPFETLRNITLVDARGCAISFFISIQSSPDGFPLAGEDQVRAADSRAAGGRRRGGARVDEGMTRSIASK